MPRSLASADTWWQRITDWEAAFQREHPWLQEVLENYRNYFGRGLLTVNMMFSYGRSLVPQLYFKNPVVGINIKRPGFEETARTIQLADDQLIVAMRVKAVLKRAILSAHLMGRGVVKLGYGPPEEDQSSPFLGTSFLPSYPTWRQREIIAPRRPWILDFSITDFAFDPTVERLRDSAWFAMRFTKKVYEVKDDPVLRAVVEKVPEDDDEDVEFWEVWDKWSGRFQVLYENEFLGESREIRYWPFYSLEFNDTLDTPWPVSDGHLMLPQQRELNEARTQIADHRRVSVLKIFARKNALSPADKAAIQRGEIAPVIEVEGEPQTVVFPFQPQVPVQLYGELNTIKEDIRDVLGFTRNQLGEFSQSRRTAMEAQIVQQALQLRLDERRDIVADYLRDIMVCVNDMIFDHWTAADVEAWAGRADGWERVPEIRTTYVVSVVPDSTLPLSRTLAKQEAQVLYGSLRGDPLVNQLWLRKHFLEQFESVDPNLALATNQNPTPGFPTPDGRVSQGGLQVLQGGRQ